MKRGVVAAIIAIVMGVGAPAGAADWYLDGWPRYQGTEGASSSPLRITLGYGERAAFSHDGEMCWDYVAGPRGQRRAIIIDDAREYRGEACEGRRVAIVRLPRRIHEDGLGIWHVGGRVMVEVYEPGSF